MMRVTVERAAKTSVVRCEGPLVLGEPLERVRDAVLCQANNIVRVDLSSVSRIDAAGLGLLASLCRLAYMVGIDLCLVNPSSHVQELLALVGLDFATDMDVAMELPRRQEKQEPRQFHSPAA